MIKYLAKIFESSNFEDLGENTETYISFSVSMDENNKVIGKKKQRGTKKIINYKLRFIIYQIATIKRNVMIANVQLIMQKQKENH